MKSKLMPVILGLWVGLWAGFFSIGCGGGGGDAAEAVPSNQANTATEETTCYFTPAGENLGEVGTPEGEEAAGEMLARKSNIVINNCNGTVNVDQSQHTTNTTANTTSNIASGNTGQ